MPLGQSIRQSLGFLLVVGLGNLFALLLLLVPGINLAAFFLVNGYLLGREYFEFAAMRFMSPADAKRLRSRNSTTIFFAGLIIAAFLSVPLLNLLTPMFAAGDDGASAQDDCGEDRRRLVNPRSVSIGQRERFTALSGKRHLCSAKTYAFQTKRPDRSTTTATSGALAGSEGMPAKKPRHPARPACSSRPPI
jgi:hypothetical protein